MIGKEGQFSKELQKSYDVFMRCERPKHIKCLRREEAICSLKGRFYDVQKAIIKVVNRLQKYSES